MEFTKQQRIWQVVMAIPAGKVASYGEVAQMAGLGRQARFVGKALGMLPQGHDVPWHRVLRTTGQIAFPVGSERFELQAGLLAEEGVEVIGTRVAMAVYRWRP